MNKNDRISLDTLLSNSDNKINHYKKTDFLETRKGTSDLDAISIPDEDFLSQIRATLEAINPFAD